MLFACRSLSKDARSDVVVLSGRVEVVYQEGCVCGRGCRGDVWMVDRSKRLQGSKQ